MKVHIIRRAALFRLSVHFTALLVHRVFLLSYHPNLHAHPPADLTSLARWISWDTIGGRRGLERLLRGFLAFRSLVVVVVMVSVCTCVETIPPFGTLVLARVQ